MGPDDRGRGGAAEDACTVDVTPRRCRRFKATPGETFKWTNALLPPEPAEGSGEQAGTAEAGEAAQEAGREKVATAMPKVTQTGTAVADAHGLVTAKGVIVTKGKHRIVISR